MAKHRTKAKPKRSWTKIVLITAVILAVLFGALVVTIAVFEEYEDEAREDTRQEICSNMRNSCYRDCEDRLFESSCRKDCDSQFSQCMY